MMSGEDSVPTASNGAASGPQQAATAEPPPVAPEPSPLQKSPEHVLQLCGYLSTSKQGKGIRTWRNKWCVFDEQRCCLHYYLTKEDFKPQGSIDISNASFTYDVENLPKNQFEICVGSNVYSFQASTKEVMFYWLNQLKEKRRDYSSQRTMNSSPVPCVTEGGLISNAAAVQPREDLPGTTAAPALGHTTSSSALSPTPTTPNSAPSPTPSTPPLDQRQERPKTTWEKMANILKPTPTPLRKPSSNFYVDAIPTEGDVPPVVVAPDTKAVASSTLETTDGPHSTQKPAPGNKKISTGFVEGGLVTQWFQKVKGVGGSGGVGGGGGAEGCHQCEEYQRLLDVKRQELSDRDEINEYLRGEIRVLHMKFKVREEMQTLGVTDERRIDVIVQREQTIEELQRLLEESCKEKDDLKTELGAKRMELQCLAEELQLCRESVLSKDSIVIGLTNRISELEHHGQVFTNPRDALLPKGSKQYEEEVIVLKDAVEAYKKQNQFLSSEIIDLKCLRDEDFKARTELQQKIKNMETDVYKIMQKYTALLKEKMELEVSAEKADSADSNEVYITHLMETVTGEERKTRDDRSGSFDQYGFNIHGYEEENPETPLAKMQRRLDRQVHLQEAHAAAAVVVAEWDNYMRVIGRTELTRTDELKDLVRKGIPDAYRSKVWKWCIHMHLEKRYNPGLYQKLLSDNVSRKNMAVGQIELDLLRTLPTNKYFSKADSKGVELLRHVLLAYSWHDPAVGYCQGINRLAAVALLFMDEEDAFWCLDCIINCLHPPHYYTKSLLGSQTDQRVLKELLQEKLPKLTQHLQMCDIDYSLVTFNWFHTVFVDNMPIDTMMRIWDTFLYEGSKVLFRYAIAIFKHNEEQLLALDNSIAIFNHLRTMCANALDADGITKIAFTEITHFSIKDINRKRRAHMAIVQAELDEVEKCRVQSSHNQYTMKALTSDSDEETWKEEIVDLPNN